MQITKKKYEASQLLKCSQLYRGARKHVCKVKESKQANCKMLVTEKARKQIARIHETSKQGIKLQEHAEASV